jgi:hypothetical protein
MCVVLVSRKIYAMGRGVSTLLSETAEGSVSPQPQELESGVTLAKCT